MSSSSPAELSTTLEHRIQTIEDIGLKTALRAMLMQLPEAAEKLESLLITPSVPAAPATKLPYKAVRTSKPTREVAPEEREEKEEGSEEARVKRQEGITDAISFLTSAYAEVERYHKAVTSSMPRRKLASKAARKFAPDRAGEEEEDEASRIKRRKQALERSPEPTAQAAQRHHKAVRTSMPRKEASKAARKTAPSYPSSGEDDRKERRDRGMTTDM